MNMKLVFLLFIFLNVSRAEAANEFGSPKNGELKVDCEEFQVDQSNFPINRFIVHPFPYHLLYSALS